MIMDGEDLKSIIRSIQLEILGKPNDSYDVLNMATLGAAVDTASYYNSHMYQTKNFANNIDLLTHGISLITKPGLICEFGVASGRTINHISNLCEQAIFGFDVFSGLPETWRTGFEAGAFAQSPPTVNKNVELIVGLFQDTLPIFAKKYQEKISFLHIDCDLYSATQTIFQCLGNKIQPGTVIVFDEYFNYPGWRHHEYKAFQEWVRENNIKYHYDSLVSSHQQVCVLIDAAG